MRIAGLVAILLLVAGCSQSTDGEAQRITPIPPNTATSSGAPGTTTSTTTTKKPPTEPPEPGAPIADVIAWIEAGTTADSANYHVATRNGDTTDLGDGVAFSTPSGKTNCMTNTMAGGALACLVDLVNPPPRPEDAYGEWKGGWVDYDGTSVAVGSVHGDPGPFIAGTGSELPYGQVLAFGDYRCRVETVGLFCANLAHNTAARINDEGVEPFGCLRKATAPPQIGEMFSC